jgi:hypothetical protein
LIDANLIPNNFSKDFLETGEVKNLFIVNFFRVVILESKILLEETGLKIKTPIPSVIALL